MTSDHGDFANAKSARCAAGIAVFVSVFVFAATMSAQDETGRAKPAPPDFQKDIQPLLVERCVKCHGPDKQQGGLRLDIKAAAFKGGDSDEPGIVPGQTDKSRLFQLVTSQDKDERMPSEGEPLTDRQIDLLKRWIEASAIWPDSDSTPAKPTRAEMVVTDEDRKHW